jgi:predicted ester cyclase
LPSLATSVKRFYSLPCPQNCQVKFLSFLAERDLISIRGVMHGVHNGLLMNLPPTGKQVIVPFFIIYRIADDKIVQHWMLVDMPSLMQQIGAVPA